MLLYFIYLTVAIFAIGKLPFFKNTKLKPHILQLLFLIKIATGFVVLQIYTNYYPAQTSDMHHYFIDGKILYEALKESPLDYLSMLTGIGDTQPHLMKYYDTMSYWIKPFDYNLYNDNKLVIRLNGFLMLLSKGNIHIHSLFFNLISFIGLVAIFRFIAYYISKQRQVIALIAIFLTPTILFWGSGMLKENLMIFVMGLFLWSLNEILNKKINWHKLLILVVSASLFAHSKIYVSLSIIPGVIWLIINHFYNKNRIAVFLSIHLLLFFIAINLHYINPNFDLLKIIATKQHDFIQTITHLQHANSAINIPTLSGTFTNILKLAPNGLINSFFRPHIFEYHNITSLAAAIENLFITLGITLVILFPKFKQKQSPLPYFCLSFSIILMIIIGITTPVLGALVRYKLPAMPFIMVLLADTFDANKFSRTMHRFKFDKSLIIINKSLERTTRTIFID